MKRLVYFIALTTAVILPSCDNDEINTRLNPNADLSFNGTFRTINSDDVSGAVTLQISGGYYDCATNLPFGHGAGKLEVNKSTINFVDTLFFPIPAIYGPSYVLSGEHQYKFDGNKLEIWRAKNVGEIEYKLTLIR
jgi:hypothetical protein